MTAKKFWNEATLWLIGIPVFLWTVLPIYHMVLIAISPKDMGFTGKVWPDTPTLRNFDMVLESVGQ
jgi:multiple sugar transport system permease protein